MPEPDETVSWRLHYTTTGILSQRGGTEKFRLDLASLQADPHVASFQVIETSDRPGYIVEVFFIPGVDGPQNPAIRGLNAEMARAPSPAEWGYKAKPPVYEGEVDHDWKAPEPPKTAWDRIMEDDSDLDDPG